MKLPEIPLSYMQITLILALVVLTFAGFNHFVQASIGCVVGFLFGKQTEHMKGLAKGV